MFWFGTLPESEHNRKRMIACHQPRQALITKSQEEPVGTPSIQKLLETMTKG